MRPFRDTAPSTLVKPASNVGLSVEAENSKRTETGADSQSLDAVSQSGATKADNTTSVGSVSFFILGCR